VPTTPAPTTPAPTTPTPALTTTDSLTAYTVGDTSVIDSGLTVTDSFLPNATAQAVVSIIDTGLSYSGEDTLAYTGSVSDISVDGGSSNGNLVLDDLSGVALDVDWASALDLVTITDTLGADLNPRTVEFSLFDGTNTISGTDAFTVSAAPTTPVPTTPTPTTPTPTTPVPTTPAPIILTNSLTAYVAGTGPAIIDTGVTITDSSLPNSRAQASISITDTGSGYSGEDTIGYAASVDDITVDAASAPQDLVLDDLGGSVPDSDWSTALQQVTINDPTGADVNPRTVIFSFYDGSTVFQAEDFLTVSAAPTTPVPTTPVPTTPVPTTPVPTTPTPPTVTATHVVHYVDGYFFEISGTITYSGSPTQIDWTTTLPSNWQVLSTAGNVADSVPAVGAVGAIDFQWNASLSGYSGTITFTYVVEAPFGANGPQTISEVATVTEGGIPYATTASTDPLTLDATTIYHSADTSHLYTITVAELTRVVSLYNTRSGTVLTGDYTTDETQTDGFTPDSTRPTAASVPLPYYHSADYTNTGHITVAELTRVVSLYNYRNGTVLTGQYHVDGTGVDGFNAGP
jgi:hypothetical protein